MVNKEEIKSPQNPKRSPNIGNKDAVFSPRFRSVAAMAGWDEEAILLATVIIEDTPDRELKQKKRINLQFKSPLTNSRRKRRSQRSSPPVLPPVVLNLDDDDDEEEIATKENGKKEGLKASGKEEKKKGKERKDADSPIKPSVDLACIDKLKDELSCAICLEICFEPSTTPCGHSFCKKCLKSAADKCGKRCPKCRQIMGNGRSCTVNTVLWNTIQLLFPQEVEARKAAGATNSREDARRTPVNHDDNVRSRSTRELGVPNGDVRRRRGLPSQDEDAALAQRLQREEFMGSVHRRTHEQPRVAQSSRTSQGHPRTFPISSSRENLRAMAERAINLRMRGRQLHR